MRWNTSYATRSWCFSKYSGENFLGGFQIFMAFSSMLFYQLSLALLPFWGEFFSLSSLRKLLLVKMKILPYSYLSLGFWLRTNIFWRIVK